MMAVITLLDANIKNKNKKETDVKALLKNSDISEQAAMVDLLKGGKLNGMIKKLDAENIKVADIE